MNNDFHSDAADYLLQHMDAARRAAFERELQQNPEARTALKEVADSLAAFASQVAPAEPLSAADQRASLDAILAATQLPEKMPAAADGAGSRGKIVWLHFLWPAAAILLLALNLFEFQRPLSPPGFGRRTGPAPDGAIDPNSGSLVQSGEKSDPNSGTSNDPKAPGTKSSGTGGLASAAALDARTREVERLRRNVSDLEREQERIRGEYNALVERVARIGAIERNMNRLTTMELVDANSYARGERKGLVGIGRNILTEPGVIVAPDPVQPPAGSGISQPKLSYAWSVFDEREQRGYLNLYNLPTVPAEESLQIWMRNSDTGEYQSIGLVPSQFHGGNGSVQYTLPALPSELLITREPRGANSPTPTGPTVIRGP